MIGDKKTPRSVLQNAYRTAVTGILVEILHDDEKTAEERVSTWWTYLAKTPAMKSGSFLHADPFQTAAELQGSRERDLSAEEGEVYRRILRHSMEAARRAREPEKTHTETEMRQPVQSASSSPSSKAGILTRRAFAGARN